jgi:hypothetical protein
MCDNSNANAGVISFTTNSPNDFFKKTAFTAAAGVVPGTVL